MHDPYNSTNAKSLNSYCGFAPKNIIKGRGVFLYDQTGKEFLDCSMALGSVSLGYTYKKVDNFVINKIKEGINFSRPSYLEEQLTNTFMLDLNTTDIIVKYSKSSSMILSIIPRISRFLTNKSLIAFPKNCFLGNTDWYLSHNSNSGGILNEVKSNVLTFEGGNCNSLRSLFENNVDKLACIIMEPYRNEIYSEEFYNLLHSLSSQNGVIVIFDETITGYRFHYPLAQYSINYKPDLTVIGKAFSNGYALAAVIGSKSLMNKIEKASIEGKIFDFSTTHAGETIGLAAALKTLQIYRELNVTDHINQNGIYIFELINNIIKKTFLENVFHITGQPTYFKLQCKIFDTNHLIMTDLCKFFFERGILFKGLFSISFSHKKKDLDRIAEVFLAYCRTVNIA